MRLFLLPCLGVAALLAGCKIEKTAVVDPSQTATSVFINDASFDPAKMVDTDWDTTILPALRTKAGPYDEVADAIAANPDAAGDHFGFRETATGGPWTYVAKLDGTVTAANTESRAATLDIKTAAGKLVTVQIGPVVRGTTIRDTVTTRPFGSFKNQVDYAQFGKSLNAKANATTLAKLPRQDLIGAHVTALGAFQAGTAGAAPLFTPVEITVGAKP
ncbi:DUF2291 domain-containing protein [Lichenihabitans sp. PAMC28606]|uniref:DUF2291 family protein n=1 Tax=Lichenihabitans sp. PAMC28606 TaxID=2880932 RepID=UPI001D0AF712|nr:DUF2291 domain-containing protein [Lichenihabitans sp. PAMC28606]UDL96400.1 DUF2291 domain-containing protein [Lichenihabitans sp. PAMC28606]